MTVPVPSPPQALVPKPPRTWRPMVGWTLGILAALGLAWFVGAVVVPVWQVQSVIQRLNRATSAIAWSMGTRPGLLERASSRILSAWGNTDELVADLGGRAEASRKLGMYLRMPTAIAPDKVDVITMLCYCDAPGRPVLLASMKNNDPAVRIAAIAGILCNGCESDPAPDRGDPAVYIFPGGDAETRAEARVVCRELLNDREASVRTAAAEALKKIEGEEPPK